MKALLIFISFTFQLLIYPFFLTPLAAQNKALDLQLDNHKTFLDLLGYQAHHSNQLLIFQLFLQILPIILLVGNGSLDVVQMLHPILEYLIQ